MGGKFVFTNDGLQVENKDYSDRMKAGGPLLSLGIHCIDLVRWWLGSPVVSSQAVGAITEEYAAPEHAWLHLRHENGAQSIVEVGSGYCNTALQPLMQLSCDVIGAEGVVHYDYGSRKFQIRSSSESSDLSWYPPKDWTAFDNALVSAMDRKDTSSLPTGKDGFAAARIAREALEQLGKAGP